MWRLCHLQQLTALVCSVCFATLQLVWDVTLHSYCLKTTHSHVLFFHSHNTLQILIGDIAYSTLKKAGQLTCTIEVNGLVIIFKCVALLVVFLLKGLFTKYVAKLAKGKSPKWYCCITAMDFEHCKIIHLFQTFLYKIHFGLNVWLITSYNRLYFQFQKGK